MAGMKLGWNLVIGLERSLSYSKSVDDPAVGEYVVKIDPRGYPQAIIYQRSEIKVRIGPWNGEYWVGYPVTSPGASDIFVFNEKEVYYEFNVLDNSVFSLLTLNPSGIGHRIFWTTKTRSGKSSRSRRKINVRFMPSVVQILYAFMMVTIQLVNA